MTEAALQWFEQSENGFFLMVEGGRIDHAAHDNDIEKLVRETAQFAMAVETAFTWAKEREDTLIIVTADHETGDLVVLSAGQDGTWEAGRTPEVTFRKTSHTDTEVPYYIWGPADWISQLDLPETLDNTNLFEIMITGYNDYVE
jgi:alkaline phosphatase